MICPLASVIEELKQVDENLKKQVEGFQTFLKECGKIEPARLLRARIRYNCLRHEFNHAVEARLILVRLKIAFVCDSDAHGDLLKRFDAVNGRAAHVASIADAVRKKLEQMRVRTKPQKRGDRQHVV